MPIVGFPLGALLISQSGVTISRILTSQKIYTLTADMAKLLSKF
jgi:hypothetical protein